MPPSPTIRPPLACRALIRAASWIVPARLRAEWRARWDASLWNWWLLFERGELTGRDRAELMRYSWGSFRDAFWLRISPEQLRHSYRSALFVLVSAALALAALAAGTRGFSETRALFEPLPLDEPGNLVAIKYTGAANQPFGVPPRLVPLWREKSRLLSGLAGFVHPQYTWQAWVTPDFFSVMGVDPAVGRLFQPGDRDVAVLSAAAAKGRFGRARGAVGQTIDLDGRPHVIIGVLPPRFWAISRSIDVFTLLDLEPQPGPGVPFLVGAVGRLRNRATPDAVRNELFGIASQAHQFLPRPPQVTSFDSVPSGPGGYLAWVLFALVIGGVLVVQSGPLPSGRGWQYWAFLAVKTVFLILLPSLLWIELTMRARLIQNEVTVLLTRVLPALSFLVVCACAVWWSFADQRRRCPVCLQRLTMPVTMGSWGSVLEPATTELLCEFGHGSLCIPDGVEGAPDRWTEMDPSWSELFGKK